MKKIHSIDELLDQITALIPENKPNPSLERIKFALEIFGNPNLQYPVIHIAGTNGKSSVSRMIDSILLELGYQTGRFLSPHLKKINERISVNYEDISDEDFIQLFNDNLDLIIFTNKELKNNNQGELTFFELLTLLAFTYFADFPIDVGIIEVGLGGTWDATNLVNSKVQVINPISLDHTNILGNDILDIAKEKFGIVNNLKNENVQLVLGKQNLEVTNYLNSEITKNGLSFSSYGENFYVKDRKLGVGGQIISIQSLTGIKKDIFLPLFGSHQAENGAVALAAVENFIGIEIAKKIPIETIRNAFASVDSPGRLEPIGSKPTVLVDAAHNQDAAKNLSNALKEDFNFKFLVGIVAVFDDKDSKGFLQELEDTFDKLIVTENSSFRTKSAEALESVAISVFSESNVILAYDLNEAVNLAYELIANNSSSVDDTSGNGIVITGSITTIAEASEIILTKMKYKD